MKPRIQFFKRDDGVRLAYSMFGAGPPMVVASPWVSNLALAFEDPFTLHFWNQISEYCTIVLYDKHGCGQSDRNRQEFDVESELTDLRSVVRHLGLDTIILFGNSMAGPISINYTAQDTNKVSHLILYGTYANGKNLAKDAVRNAIIALVKASWGMGSKALADLFIPNATSESVSQWSRFQKESASPKVAAGLIELNYYVDVTPLLDQIDIPTLVLHRRGDSAISFQNGKELAHSIPNARFKALNGSIHFPFYEEPEVIIGEVLKFLSIDGTIANVEYSKSGNYRTSIEPSDSGRVGNSYKRQLAALLSADVKGYSRLMGDDEIHTIQTLKEYRQTMAKAIEEHNGRIIDNPGDNLLAEFLSAVDAVKCAIEIQKALKESNKSFRIKKRLEFRIGINIGDVIHDGDRIYGEGVNIAARIESLADAGGICISRNTYDHIKNKLNLDTEYLGEHDVKNIKEPVRVYKVLVDTEPLKPLVENRLELPDKPSIAVLPFDNLSGDPDQEYFSDGLTEQIINGLCKVPSLFVIARNSSFAYKGKAVSVKQIAKELGVRYILEGSVQRAGNRIRITAQLIDAVTDFHMWSENYDRKMEDIFALQDEITMKLINEMQINLTHGEQARLWEGHQTSNIVAYDRLMRGIECSNHYNKQDNIQARKFAEEAISLDKDYAMAYIVLGFCHLNDAIYWWSKSARDSVEQAYMYAVKAGAISGDFDWPHTLLGYISLMTHHHDTAIEEGEKALSINPNGADTISFLANSYGYCGQSEKALDMIERAFRLNPVPPPWYYAMLGMIYHMKKEYQEAISASNKCVSLAPDYLNPYIFLAASYASLGKSEIAQVAVKNIRRVNPKYSLRVAGLSPYKNATDLNNLMEGLRKAGLPD